MCIVGIFRGGHVCQYLRQKWLNNNIFITTKPFVGHFLLILLACFLSCFLNCSGLYMQVYWSLFLINFIGITAWLLAQKSQALK